MALNKQGYTAETFVTHLYYITNRFDIVWGNRLGRLRAAHHVLWQYKALYIYFCGGPFAWLRLKRLEPWLYKIAGVKILVMPYGGDCQNLSLCKNLRYKHAMNSDYPEFSRGMASVCERIERWSRHADYIISGCDWVDYTPRWDALCLAHFSIDTDSLIPLDETYPVNNGKIVILHAPNHKAIKGSSYFIQAVNELQAEGYPVELELCQNMPNNELRERIRRADIIADQLVIGWYAMFALEGMCAGKPVMCYLRQDLVELYEFANLINPGELPFVLTDHKNVKDNIRMLLEDRTKIGKIGQASRAYVVRHHSLEKIGQLFDSANQKMGIDGCRDRV